MKLIVKESADRASRYVADLMVAQVQAKPHSLLGLATGGTMIPLYDFICSDYQKGSVDFSSARTVNLDEYLGLAQNHKQSFAYFMNKHLFGRTNFKEKNIFLLHGDRNEQEEIDHFNLFCNATSLISNS